MSDWTYGAEHEWGDVPLARGLPEGYGWDVRDVTIVNSNGVANDPSGKLYGFGGEINTPPTSTPEGQVACLQELRSWFPEAVVNYRSNLHIHVRVPGLRQDLSQLKRVQAYIHQYMPLAWDVIEPLPRPVPSPRLGGAELDGALRRWRRRRVSHQTLLRPERLHYQLQAVSVDEFFRREPPAAKTTGKPLWTAQPRLCVSLRQLLQTDTVEFRHFPGTLDEQELGACVGWCRRFLEAALDNASFLALLEWARSQSWPAFPEYKHWQEVRYRATVHDGSLRKEQIRANIQAILEGTFGDA